MQRADTSYFHDISSTSINEAVTRDFYSRCFIAFVDLFETSELLFAKLICMIICIPYRREIPHVLNSLQKRNAKKKNDKEKNHEEDRREEVGPS